MKRNFMCVIDQNFIKCMGNFMCNVNSSLYKLHPLNISGPESTRGQSRPCHGLRAPEVVRMCITLLHTYMYMYIVCTVYITVDFQVTKLGYTSYSTYVINIYKRNISYINMVLQILKEI